MRSSVRSPVLVLMLLGAASTGSGAAAQEAAKPDQRCGGTLCDLYYGAFGSKTPQPAVAGAPQPASKPGFFGFFSGDDATPAAKPSTKIVAPVPDTPDSVLQGEGRGGLISMLKGAPPQRCTGTLCDFYYGGSPEPEQPAAAVPPVATADAGPRSARARRVAEDEPVAKPRCVATANDPWKCYR